MCICCLFLSVNLRTPQSDYPYYQDNYNTNIPQPPPLMSAKPLMNYSNSYESKPSNTFERLQSLLEISNPLFDHQQYQINSSSSSENSNWSSSRYLSNQNNTK